MFEDETGVLRIGLFYSPRECLSKNALFEGFEGGGLAFLERLEGTDFFGESVEFFDDFLLFGERWERWEFKLS